MATIFTDGFDKYGPAGEQIPSALTLITQSEWTAFTGSGASLSIVAGLSETGYAVQLNGPTFGSQLAKTLTKSYGRLIGGFRFNVNLTEDTGMAFLDSSTYQCYVYIQASTGFICIRESNSGSILQTSSVSVSANTTHYLEFDITYATSGSWTIWLDGVQVLNGNGQTAQSSNNSANVVAFLLAGVSGGGGLGTFDDFYLFDTTSDYNNAALLSNPRIETKFPAGDKQTQFTNNGNILGVGYSATTDTHISGANSLYLRQFTPQVTSTINSIAFLPEATDISANFKPLLYSDSSGAPETLISAGSTITGTVSGTVLTLSLTTPTSLVAGTPYWIGYMTDSSVALAQQDTASNLGYQANYTFSSGPPATAPSTAETKSILLYGNCTGAVYNFASEDLNPPLGNISGVSSNTAGNEDLYSFPVPSTDIVIVYSVAVKAHSTLSTAGARSIALHVYSGSTDSSGSLGTVGITTAYEWYGSYFDTDPNTEAPWGNGVFGSVYCGMSLVS